MPLRVVWLFLVILLLFGCYTPKAPTQSSLAPGAHIARQAGEAVGETTVLYASSTESSPDVPLDREVEEIESESDEPARKSDEDTIEESSPPTKSPQTDTEIDEATNVDIDDAQPPDET